MKRTLRERVRIQGAIGRLDYVIDGADPQTDEIAALLSPARQILAELVVPDRTDRAEAHQAFYDALRHAREQGLVTLMGQAAALDGAPCVRAVSTAGDALLLSLDLEAMDASALRALILLAAT